MGEINMIDNKPKVSILIPVYNRENLIQPCIESALAQTYDNIEIIVVDNKSTDRTWEYCKAYEAKYDKVKVYQNEKNLGPVRNWLQCMKYATGEYGKILFSDDLIYETYIDETVSMMKDDVGFVFSNMEIGPERTKGEPSYGYMKKTGFIESKEYLIKSLTNEFSLVSPGAALFRMSDLKNNLMWQKNSIPSPTIKDFAEHGAGPDLLLYLLTAADYPRVAYVNNVLGLLRAHIGSISISDRKTHYLEKCYFQARIDCAKEKCSTVFVNYILINKWIYEIASNKQFIAYSTFIKQYLYADEWSRYPLKYNLVICTLKKMLGKKLLRLLT